ncbi:MAG: hypothetical protein K9W43_12670 [Candidatus Thorarchaeota archaeon]|nr:hypothetical protein [Candidatus Thorarchaeota archaeon]
MGADSLIELAAIFSSELSSFIDRVKPLKPQKVIFEDAIEQVVDFANKSSDIPILDKISNLYTRVELLSHFLLTSGKNHARVGNRDSAGLLKILKTKMNLFLKNTIKDYLQPLGLLTKVPDLTLLPVGSFFISFRFKLDSPYLSKDDTDLYVIDNPVRKEWIFKVPYIAPSQWKGALRSVLVHKLESCASAEEFISYRIQLSRLFGIEKGVNDDIKNLYLYSEMPEAVEEYLTRLKSFFSLDEDQGIYYRGRLYFYPTFFNTIGMEVINPHNPLTAAGTKPIYFECVPRGTSGDFCLLYIPAWPDLGGGPNCIRDDFHTIAEGISDLLTTEGIGAKVTSGYGLVQDIEQGIVQVKTKDPISFSSLSELANSSKFDKMWEGLS